MQKVRRLLQQPGLHALAFLLFLFLSVWPVLSIPGRSRLSDFFVYLFSIWTLMVLALFLWNRGAGNVDAGHDGDRKGQGGDRRV